MLRILLVDDHALLRVGLITLLRREIGEIDCYEAPTFREARDHLQRGSWDMVLMDIALPERDGFELLAEARTVRPAPPVIILSTCASIEYGVEAIRRGASAYLPKRATCAEVVLAVREALAGRRYIPSDVANHLAQALVASERTTLTSRELQVLRLLSEGRNLTQIASHLCVSPKTVFTYKSRIYSKLNVNSVAGLVKYALQRGVAS